MKLDKTTSLATVAETVDSIAATAYPNIATLLLMRPQSSVQTHLLHRTMTETRLNSLLRLFVHRDRSLNYDAITDAMTWFIASIEDEPTS